MARCMVGSQRYFEFWNRNQEPNADLYSQQLQLELEKENLRKNTLHSSIKETLCFFKIMQGQAKQELGMKKYWILADLF